MATIEYSRGQDVTIEPFPKELIYFSLAKEFGWLPSQIEKEKYKDIKGVLTVLTTVNKVQNKKMENLDKKKGKFK